MFSMSLCFGCNCDRVLLRRACSCRSDCERCESTTRYIAIASLPPFHPRCMAKARKKVAQQWLFEAPNLIVVAWPVVDFLRVLTQEKKRSCKMAIAFAEIGGDSVFTAAREFARLRACRPSNSRFKSFTHSPFFHAGTHPLCSVQGSL